jgi:hypothetical protein
MIELLPETRGNVIAVKMSETITEEDFGKYFAEADVIFDRERVEHLVYRLGATEGLGDATRLFYRHVVRHASPRDGRACRRHRR